MAWCEVARLNRVVMAVASGAGVSLNFVKLAGHTGISKKQETGIKKQFFPQD